MQSARFKSPPPPGRAQRGVVLIVALIVLVLITIVSVTAIRATTTDERMAGNARDRDKAFQAAEAAVRSCLAPLDTDTPALGSITVHTPAATGTTPVWEVADNWDADSTASFAVTSPGSADDAGLKAQPRCMIERLNATPASYRVTGRAVGASEDTVVMLQATISAE